MKALKLAIVLAFDLAIPSTPAVVLLATSATVGECLVGRARVLDGETIVVGGFHTNLGGVAAPELHKTRG